MSRDAGPDPVSRGVRTESELTDGGEQELVLAVPEALAVRLDRVLTELLNREAVLASRATVQRWIAEGRVRVDGQICLSPKSRVRVGAELRVTKGQEPSTAAVPDHSVLYDVLFEDEHLIVVDKPAGLVVHPGRGHRTGTLVNGLLARPGFGRPPADERDPEGQLRPGIVHRIDKETSGALVVAKTAEAREGLKAQFASHSIERLYLALTLGVPVPGRVDTRYGRHPKQRLKFSSLVREGKWAVSEFQIREAFGLAALVECRLRTGRTHQIRVHLTEQLGTPLLADSLYGRSTSDERLERVVFALGRQALHAAVLGFIHPVSEQTLRFESELPKDMSHALDQLRAIHAGSASG